MYKTALIMLGILPLFSVMAETTSEFKTSPKTDDPRKYVLLHSETPDSNLSQFDCRRCSSMKDLVFVTTWKGCGTAGCNYFIFKKTRNSFKFVTRAFLHPGAFEFLKSKHHGLHDVIFYHHMSAEDGTLENMEYDGKNYLVIKSEKIKGTEFGSRIPKPEIVDVVSFSKDLKKIDN